MIKNISDLLNFANSTAETERYPTPEDRLIKGHPAQNNRMQFSAAEKFFAGEWGAEAGCRRGQYTESKYFHILSGQSILRDTASNELALNSGDKVSVPAGFEGAWELLEPTQKTYVMYYADSSS